MPSTSRPFILRNQLDYNQLFSSLGGGGGCLFKTKLCYINFDKNNTNVRSIFCFDSTYTRRDEYQLNKNFSNSACFLSYLKLIDEWNAQAT